MLSADHKENHGEILYRDYLQFKLWADTTERKKEFIFNFQADTKYYALSKDIDAAINAHILPDYK